jgi:serine/threonine protein kinase
MRSTILIEDSFCVGLLQLEPLDMKKKIKISIGMVRGVSYLHSMGVMHRDIKSMNILVTHDWDTKITDFGASRLTPTASEHATDNIGTCYWMAPEGILAID